MNIVLIVILVVIVVGGGIMVLLAKRGVRRYTVYMANPEQSEVSVYRTFGDRWWALDAGAFVTFRRHDGHKIRINKHWIIKIESEGNARD